MILSILIPSTRERKPFLDQLLAILTPQMKDHDMEVLMDFGGEHASKKRNSMMKDAQGKYVWFLNDGDLISETAVEDILNIADKDPDVIGISGMTTINGGSAFDWEMRLQYDKEVPTILNGRNAYLKPISHIAPIKRDLAIQVPFTNKMSKWVKTLLDSDLLRTQEIIKKPIYHIRHVV